MFLAFSTFVLFISLMQLMNGAEFFNITLLLALFASASAAAALLTAIVPLTRIYASL